MRFYETIYIVNPNFENDKINKCQEEIESELSKTKAKIINHRIWNKKRLAYSIDKQKYGTYILLQFECVKIDTLSDFDTWMKLNNQVLRHMTTTLSSRPDVYVEEEQKEDIKNSVDSDNKSTIKDDSELNEEDSNKKNGEENKEVEDEQISEEKEKK